MESDKFLQDHFKSIMGIRQLHHLEFDSLRPGIVSVKKSLQDERTDITILATTKEAVHAAGMHIIIPPGGLSMSRMEDLFESIRPHVP